ncbi:DUF262 domain-containing protein [Priestia megaterium]|uniref:DUF262 domain-containing protein n=1 Tax=Priestia megaterium TaxID=1404 RepID=UPI0012B7529D|nr:DUF262 domain-containing HNH endonuclease family protein [Priestia megaterium]
MKETQLKAYDDNSIADIFMANKYSMKIPLNQRKFDWNMAEVEAYWEDFQQVLNRNTNHYLGVLSFIITDDNLNRNRTQGSIYEVTDGQQRIITTSLLISALRDVYLFLDNDEQARKIHKTYLICDEVRYIYDQITVSKLDDYTFSKLVNIHEINGKKFNLVEEKNITFTKDGGRKVKDDSGNYINKKMIDTYNFFYAEIIKKCNDLSILQEKEDLLTSIETGLRSLQIIMITSRDPDFLYMFFDTINNRGLQLNKMDIIRNKLLSIISNLKPDCVSDIGELWDELVINLDNQEVSRFLKYYYMCSQDKILQANQLPNRFEQLFKDLGDYTKIKAELERMIDYTSIYRKLFDNVEVSLTTENYKKSISNINDIGQQACYSFLMDYFYYIKEESRKNTITNALEKLMFRRVVCKASTKELDGIFKNFMQEGRQSDDNKIDYDDKKILELIKSNNPNEADFLYNFVNREWDRSNLTNYVLRQVEYQLVDNDSEYWNIIKSRKEVHIEHIAPDTPNDQWLSYLRLNKNEYKKYVSKIGNLTLLKSELNIQAKQKNFTEKKSKYYSESKLEQVKEILNTRKWSKTKIDERTVKLYNECKDLWTI